MNNIVKINKDKKMYLICKGTFISILCSLFFIFLYAIILVNTNVQENTIEPVIYIITGVSVLIGSSISCFRVKKNGLINGICIGGLYILLLYILSSIALCGFYFNLSSIIMIIIGMILGGIGGIIGVNFYKK